MKRKTSFGDFVLDQLAELGEVDGRAMFGGVGLYRRHVFFGIVYKDRLYFLTNASTREDYVARGMRPFRPSARQTLGNYYEVPAEIVEDRHHLAVWARKAVACQSTRTRRGGGCAGAGSGARESAAP